MTNDPLKMDSDMDSNGEPTENADSPISHNALVLDSEAIDHQIPCNNNNNIGTESLNSQCPEPAVLPRLTSLCMTELMSSNPAVLLGYISFLQERVGLLASDRKRLLDENLQLRRRINQVRREAPSESEATISDTETFASDQTCSNTSVSLNGLSVSQIQIPAMVEASDETTVTTTSASTPVLSLYSRYGQEEAQPLTSCSSHSIVIIRQASLLSSQNSTNSLEDAALCQGQDITDQADTINGNIEASQVEDSSDDPRNTCRSTPNIETEALSGCTIASDLCLDIEDVECYQQFVKHPRHSWPIISNLEELVMTDFTAHLSSYVIPSDTDSDDESSDHSSQYTTTDDDDESSVFISATATNVSSGYGGLSLSRFTPEFIALIESAAQAEAEELPLSSDSANSNYVDANEFSNVDLTSNSSQPVEEIMLPSPRVNGIIEHPFQTGLQSSNNEFRQVVLFRNPEHCNSGVEADPRLAPGLQVGPRHQAIRMSITLNGLNREESFMSRLRSQLYYNINVFTTELDMISPVDEAGSDNSLAFVTDNSDSSRGSIPQFEGHELDDDQIAENLGLDYDNLVEDGNPNENEDPAPEDAADSDSQSSSSNSDTGQGDAEAAIMLLSSSSSSATSLPQPSVERRRAPTWMLPSSTDIGAGRYDFLRVTDRPRPYHGHRFVISVFGTKARKENEARLPSWVPTYAERLECILNQYIQQKHFRSTCGQMKSGASRKHSGRRSIFETAETTESWSEFYCQIRRNTSSIKQLKSCLKMNREGAIGESIAKVISWSEQLCHVDDGSPRSPQEDLNSNAVPELDTAVTQTKSCPEMYCNATKSTSRTQRKNVLCPKRIPICPLEIEPAGSRKKKRAFGAIFKRVCNCRRCSCVTTLSSTSSTCCSHGLESNT